MRQAIQDRRRFIQTSRTVEIPAPVGGWNASKSLASMPQLDAIIMDNWLPENDGVNLRAGDQLFAQNMSGDIETLATFISPTTSQLLAASDGNVYDITSGTPSSKGSGFTNAQWQTATFNSHLFFTNGADTVQDWDGTTLGNSTFTGVTLANLINVNVVFQRLWFTEKDKGKAWYGPLGGVTGTLTVFDIDEIAREGYLVQVASWSRDAGDGMDDLTVFIMSTGECLIYSGDPAATFSLVGIYSAPPPIGRRCTVKLGGELVVVTRGGYFTMTSIMKGQTRPEDALSAKIRNAVAAAFDVGGVLDGWDIILSPDHRKLIVNVPVSDGLVYYQHVYDTVTKAWGRWKDRNIQSLVSYNGNLYGGFVGGKVYKLEVGRTDASRSDANIAGYAVQAFTPPGPNQQLTMIRPFMGGTGKMSATVSALSDYKVAQLTPSLQELDPAGLFWEEYLLDSWEDWTLPWGEDEGGVSTLSVSANVIGRTFAPAVSVDTNQTVQWHSTELTLKTGGII